MNMLNVNEPTSVARVIEFLVECPPDWVVRPYEGEGGNWIVVEPRGVDDDHA